MSNDNNEEQEALSATDEMCKYCFDVLIDTLTDNPTITKEDIEKGIESSIPKSTMCPLFVTWDKQKYNNSIYNLRGCIGTLAPRQLRYALGEYAKTSGLHDPRFQPISISEIPSLRVSVSLLVNYEECEHCLDWEVGVHGILINFDHQLQNYSATFLPEVASEQKWTQQETIRYLVEKSGFRHKLTPEIQSTIRCTRYQSSKQYMTYEQYRNTAGSLSIQNYLKK